MDLICPKTNVFNVTWIAGSLQVPTTGSLQVHLYQGVYHSMADTSLRRCFALPIFAARAGARRSGLGNLHRCASASGVRSGGPWLVTGSPGRSIDLHGSTIMFKKNVKLLLNHTKHTWIYMDLVMDLTLITEPWISNDGFLRWSITVKLVRHTNQALMVSIKGGTPKHLQRACYFFIGKPTNYGGTLCMDRA